AAAGAAAEGPDAAPKLLGGLLRVGDHEDRLDVETLVAHGARESLDEHLRLSGPRARGDEDDPACINRRLLFAIHARRTLHIDHRSHHVGQEPPRGSYVTSPPPINPPNSPAPPTPCSPCHHHAPS